MQAALTPTSYNNRNSPAQRLASAALALAMALTILLMLIEMGLIPIHPLEVQHVLSTFSLQPSKEPAAERKASAKAKEKTKSKAASKADRTHAAAPPPAAAPPLPVSPIGKAPPSKLMKMSNDAFAATDIGKLPSQADDGGEGTDNGKDSGAAYGPGEGPGGQRLYDVAWYREPSRGELVPYLPHGAPPGSAELACRMIADYHVENCRELSERPQGSGLARAMRLASWQFRVRPPRVGGKTMLGGWVRIHFSWTEDRDK